MEQQSAFGAAAVGRGHNAVYFLPIDWNATPDVLAPALDRVDAESGIAQSLVLAADPDAAAGIAQALIAARGGAPPRVLAATGTARASRLLRAGAAPVVVGAPREILGLVRGSALKLDAIRTIVIAWVDEILASAPAELETIMSEAPKDAPRIVITAQLTGDVSDFLERHARRAPRHGHPVSGEATPPDSSSVTRTGAVSYVLVASGGRALALRRLLDDIDPPSADIYVRTDESEREVRNALGTLGYHDERAPVRVRRGAWREHTALLVLYDLPHSPDEWTTASAGEPARVAALVLPRQLAHLSALAGGKVLPILVGNAVDTVRARDAALRGELRRELAQGTAHRELLALEPLLSEADPVAVAAAALRLLERERQQRATERARTPIEHPVAAWTPGERPRRGDRPERQERGGDRGYRGDRADRGGRRDRGEQPDRGDRGYRGERPDRGERGDRPRHERSARSGPQAGDRRPDFRDRGPRRRDRPGPRREDRS